MLVNSKLKPNPNRLHQGQRTWGWCWRVVCERTGGRREERLLVLKMTPHGSAYRPSAGNLVLVRRNVTWSEALSHCRKRHVDLVHIDSADVQETVAELARNATSSHVWVGLRYACSFNFWFWTSSSSACYQNWALGQGPEGDHGCGVTGAVETTGGQQWVGLPETRTLNFICFVCDG